MYIKVKPELVASSDGFGFYGNPLPRSEVDAKLCRLKVSNMFSGKILVYWCEKHRKPKTHWKYKIWSIDEHLMKLLKLQGQKIVQHKHHWSIEKIS